MIKFRVSKPVDKNKMDLLLIQKKIGAKEEDVERKHKIRL